jgi:hypothetical protein
VGPWFEVKMKTGQLMYNICILRDKDRQGHTK